MGMWTTENQDTLRIVLNSFSAAAREHYEGHAYEAGYLQSVIISMLPDMPKRKQKQVIEDMVRATQKQEKHIIEKMNKKTAAEQVEGF